MQIHTSILGSALAHGVMMAVLLLGAWEIELVETESATFQEFVDHTHHVAISLPDPPPEEETPEPPEPELLELAASEQSERELPREEDEDRGVEEPEQPEEVPEEPPQELEQPEEPEPEQLVEPEPPAEKPEKTIKPLVASLEPDPEPRVTTQEIADKEKPVLETAGASVANTKPSKNTGNKIASTTKGTSDAGTKPGPGIGGGIDREGLIRAYQKKVYLLVKRNTAPPRAARRARLEGTAYVIVTFDERGQILSVRLRKSSGHKVLDEDAISTVKNLRSLPKPPGELGWTRKSLTIPIRYKRS
jgi:protein TonB